MKVMLFGDSHRVEIFVYFSQPDFLGAISDFWPPAALNNFYPITEIINQFSQLSCLLLRSLFRANSRLTFRWWSIGDHFQRLFFTHC